MRQTVDLTGSTIDLRVKRGDPCIWSFWARGAAAWAESRWLSQIRREVGAFEVVTTFTVDMTATGDDVQVTLSAVDPSALKAGTYVWDMQESSDGVKMDGFTPLDGTIIVEADVTR